jgi:hypothetical protein
MGQRGPARKPGSVRWNRELRKKQKVAADEAYRAPSRKGASSEPRDIPELPAHLPTCPKCLPKPVQAAWSELVMDAIAAGVSVKQFDARGFVVAAGQEVDLYDLESAADGGTPLEVRLAVIGRKEQIRKSFLASLVAIGGTPLARLRARITPEEKKPAADDPWSQL